MKFHPTGTDPTPEALVVCRNSRRNLVLILAAVWFVPIAVWLMSASWWWVALMTAMPIVFTWPILRIWRRRGEADNWVLALYRDGAWLNLRDCEYQDAAPAETVVFVPYGEIASARQYEHRFTTPTTKGGTASHKHRYLELRLKSGGANELRRLLDEERHREPPPRILFGGNVTTHSKRRDSPIDLTDDTTVRVKFSVSNYGLRPTAKQVLETLQQFVAVDADYVHDGGPWDELDDEDLASLVNALVKVGAQHHAICLLQRLKGLSTTDAQELVESLEKEAESRVN